MGKAQAGCASGGSTRARSRSWGGNSARATPSVSSLHRCCPLKATVTHSSSRLCRPRISDSVTHSASAITARTGRPAVVAYDDERRRVDTLVGRSLAAAVVLCDSRLACVGGSFRLDDGTTLIDAANAELGRVATIEIAKGGPASCRSVWVSAVRC